MRHKLNRIVVMVVLLICFVLSFPPWSLAFVREDFVDLPGIQVNDKLLCIRSNKSTPPEGEAKVAGVVTAVNTNNGKTLGQGLWIGFQNKQGYWQLGYTMLQAAKLRDWISEFGGSLEFVQSKYWDYICYLKWGSRSASRMHIGDLAKLCGSGSIWFDEASRTAYIAVTNHPGASISGPQQAAPGQTITLRLSGTSNVTSGFNGISYVLKANGNQISTKNYSQNSFSDTVSYTIPSSAGSSITFELTVKDGVWRETTKTFQLPVVSKPQPPTPPGGNMPPVADFTLPVSAESGESVTVKDQSMDYDGYIVNRSWTVSPGSGYTGSLSGTGGTLTFNKEGSYTVTLTVTDNKGATGTCSKTIYIGPAPPPPPPPEPENDPPVARFSMPSKCGPGQTVNVVNRSYDPDGSIVDVDWDISPSSGVTENLGDDGGTITFGELGTYTVELTVTDDFGDSDSIEKEIEVVNEPPEAKIIVPDKVVQGDDVVIRSASDDPDGEITRLTWTVNPAEGMIGTLSGESSTVYFDKEGQYTISLTVEDNWGATDSTEVTVNVEPAIPQAFFDDDGAYKQNRKITLTEKGQSSKRYPIIKEEDEWEIIPVGSGATAEAIFVKNVSPDVKEVLFKTPGTYKVRLRVTNTAGHTSDWYEREFEIQTDRPPVADFIVQTAYLRDVNNAKMATVDLRDASYSPDGDTIAHRTWKYRYDSDNDGDFGDEQWVVFSDSNDMTPSFQTDQVGKYQIELEVTEGFGEETISEFVTPEDCLKADTSAKPLGEKRTEVVNVRPTVGFKVFQKKKADIVFTVGTTNPAPCVAWHNHYLDVGQFTQVIEAEGGQAVRQGTWNLSPDGKTVYLVNGSVKATFTRQETSVYIQFKSCDQNDGYAEVYVDGTFYGKQDTRNQGHYVCEVTNLPNTTHTVEVRTGGNGDLHIDFFAVKNNSQASFDGAIVQNLTGLIDRYLKPELNAKNVDASISSVETSTITTQTNFPWSVYNLYGTGFGSGDGQFQVEGSSYRYRGYGAEAPIDHLYYDDGLLNAKREFSFNIDMTGYNACATIIPGFIFGANDRNGFSGYIALMWHNKIGVYYFSGSNHTVLTRNWAGQVAATRNPSSFGGTQIAYVSTRDTSLQKSFRMVYKAPTLEIYDGGVLLATVDCPQAAGNGYGVAAANSAHGCGARSYIRFDNFKLNTTSGKALDEVLKDSSIWREDAIHFLVNISAVTYPEFNDPVKSAYIYSRLLNDRIDFSVLGSAANQSQAADIIARNDGNGTFIENRNRDTTMQQLTQYIISKLDAAFGQLENYVLLNEEVYYETYYGDFEQDPKYAERWKYDHDPNYFENSLGRALFDGLWLDGPVKKFDKVGEFVTTFQARDNPKDDDRFDEYRLWSYTPDATLHLYVHRRPVAMFGVQLTLNKDFNNCYNVIISSDAYDLDHLSRPDKGIVEQKWSWRYVNSTTWNNGIPLILSKDYDCLVKYEVKDLEGAWSFPEVKLVSTRSINMAPVAQFSITPDPAVVNKPVTITDLSYDPNGTPIVQRQWRVKPPGGGWSAPSVTPPSSFNTVGEWSVELKVSDGELWSEPFYQTIQVIPDNTPPVARFTVSPNPVYACDPVTYNDTSYDPDGDPIVAREWRIRKDGGAWQYYVSPPTVFEDVGGAGIYDIELRVQDHPSLPQLEPKWSEWYRQTLKVLESFELEGYVTPNPAERGRKIRVTAWAYRPSTGQKIQLDTIQVYIPYNNPQVVANMVWNPGSMTYAYTYLIPDRTARGVWPDDGTYYIKVVGTRNGTQKEKLIPLTIKGNVLNRTFIRTYRW